MKRAILLIGLGGLAGLVVWWKRHSFVPAPQVDAGPAPAFRTSTALRPSPVPATSQPARKDTPSPRMETTSDETSAARDDLQRIKGIGPVYEGRLHAAGIHSYAALGEADAPRIAESLDVTVEVVNDWQRQAAELD